MTYHDITTEQLTRIVVDAVRQELNREPLVPAGTSVRHTRLGRKHINQLFGCGHQLQVKKILGQSGQYACEETLDIIGSEGILGGVRVLKPERNQSQMEVALTDARTLGVTPPVRASGDLTGTSSILLRGPKGEAALEQDVIVVGRHVHVNLEDAVHFHVKDRELIQVGVGKEKPDIIGHVRIRVSSGYTLDFHINADDGSTFPLRRGQPIKTSTAQEKKQSMTLGTVKRTVVPTRKVDNLVGYRFLLMEPYSGGQSKIVMADDTIGAGIGELVLVTMNETTRHVLTREMSVDTFIIRIVDSPSVIGEQQTGRQ